MVLVPDKYMTTLMHLLPLFFHVYPCLNAIKALFIWLIIRLIQLVFLARTVFFSHKKSANSVFQPAYNSSRTAYNPCSNIAT
jgi:hypothetical protein